MKSLILSIVIIQQLMIVSYINCESSSANLFNLYSNDEEASSSSDELQPNYNFDLLNRNSNSFDDLAEAKSILEVYEQSRTAKPHGESYDKFLKRPSKRTRLIKKTKPITHKGYSLDMNIENFKSTVRHFIFELNLGN